MNEVHLADSANLRHASAGEGAASSAPTAGGRRYALATAAGALLASLGIPGLSALVAAVKSLRDLAFRELFVVFFAGSRRATYLCECQ